MSPGNTKPKQPQNIDALVDRLNKKIARILGKKDKLPPNNKKTSNLMFSLILLGFSLLLWCTTGFYYLGENQYGLILVNGHISKVVKGIKVGLTYPYPFGDIKVMDASVGEFINLGHMSANADNFVVLSRELLPIMVDAKFNYQVTDPVKEFKTVLQSQDNLASIDSLVMWNTQVQIRDYFSDKPKSDILKSNLTVAANEIRDRVNQNMADVGIKVVKLSINSLTESIAIIQTAILESSVDNLGTAESSGLANELLQQANLYQQNRMSQTKVDILQFNQLLPQYKLTPDAIVQQMYYDTLEAIPSSVAPPHYPLLDLSLTDLQAMEQITKPVNASETVSSSRARHFGREVNRSRNLNMGGE